jgi:hypothetical protein
MNKYKKTIDPIIIGKLEMILAMIDHVLLEHQCEDDLKKSLLEANKLIFNHANTDEEFFDDN